MSTRKIKDAVDLSTGEKVYYKGHAKATFMSGGSTVEDAINSIQTGSEGYATQTWVEQQISSAITSTLNTAV